MMPRYCITLTAMVSALCVPATTQEEAAGILDYSHHPDDIIIQLDYFAPRTGITASPPHLQIYGDGRMVVHPFAYESREGAHEMYLQEQDIRDLLLYLQERGFMEFDASDTRDQKAAALKARRRQAERLGQRPIETIVSDASTITIDVFLDRYRPPGTLDEPVEGFHHQVKWYAIQHDAEEFPEVPALAALSEIEETLLAYAKHPDLVQVSEPPSPPAAEVER